jgi:WXG100 family type VII secretion target
MAVQLTPAQAEAKIKQIEDARDRAVAKLNQLNDTQHTMLASGWQGSSATKYGSTSDQHNDEFHGIIQKLNNIVELGSHHMRSVSSADGNS